MRVIFIIMGLVFTFFTAQANNDFLDELELLKASCASSTSQIKNIKGITKKVNLWGTWVGSHQGDKFVVIFSKRSGRFKIKGTKGGSKYGPFGVRVCDHGGNKFTGHVLGYEGQFKVLSRKRLQVISNGEKVTVTKTKNE